MSQEALAPSKPPKRTVEVVAAMMSFPVWQRFSKLELSDRKSKQLTLRLVRCAMGAATEL